MIHKLFQSFANETSMAKFATKGTCISSCMRVPSDQQLRLILY